jgi:hypothetical protein
MWGSNFTFLVDVDCADGKFKAVYKPVRGERPLWDFPPESLAGREVAAYLVSRGIGWDFVPPTVFRQDAPEGPGSLQLFIEHDPEHHYFTFRPADREQLPKVALFDYLVNNTDRKAGHMIVGPDGRLWLIDHGVCFHTEPKLRTVVWDFAGESISEKDGSTLRQFRKKLEHGSLLRNELERFLTPEETEAIRSRLDTLLQEGRFPTPTENERAYPWPAI